MMCNKRFYNNSKVGYPSTKLTFNNKLLVYNSKFLEIKTTKYIKVEYFLMINIINVLSNFAIKHFLIHSLFH